VADGKTLLHKPGQPYDVAVAPVKSWPCVRGFELRVPHRVLMLAFAVAPALYAGDLLRAWVLKRRRRAKGLCETCGYDLRASTERCPECGTSRSDPA
jgi:hypothetical protein